MLRDGADMFQMKLSDNVRERLRDEIMNITFGGSDEADELMELFERWLIEARNH